jgi:hypothetical protein
MEPRVGWLQGDQNGTVWVRGVQALMIDIDARLLPFNLCFEALCRCSLYGKSLQDVSNSGSRLAGRKRTCNAVWRVWSQTKGHGNHSLIQISAHLKQIAFVSVLSPKRYLTYFGPHT